MYYVKLIKGQSFSAFDHRFLVSEEEEVSEKIYNYLRRNEFLKYVKKNILLNYKSIKKISSYCDIFLMLLCNFFFSIIIVDSIK